MDKNRIMALMDAIPFFSDLDSQEREVLCSHPEAFQSRKAGETLLNEGDVDYGYFVLMDGRLSIMRSQPTEVVLAQLVPGAIFGEVTLKAQRIRTSSAVADENIVAFKVDGKLAGKLPSGIMLKMKDQVIALLINRLEEVNKKLGTFIR